jgi:hypothetical protein
LGSFHLLSSWAHAKDKHGGIKGFVLQEISGSARGMKKTGGATQSETMELED